MIAKVNIKIQKTKIVNNIKFGRKQPAAKKFRKIKQTFALPVNLTMHKNLNTGRKFVLHFIFKYCGLLRKGKRMNLKLQKILV
jgi:hypothetical protein